MHDVLSPRAALGRVFPAWTQVWWTYFTGVALPGQVLPRRTPLWLFARSLAALLAGLAGAELALAWDQPWLLLAAYVFTVGAARYLQLVIVHVAAHDNFTRNRRFDLWTGRLVSLLLMIEQFDRYKKRHCVEHHALRTLSTAHDPTVQFLLSLGIRPGMAPAAMWQRLALALVSPAFYARGLYGRIASHFQDSSAAAKALAASYLAALLCAAWFLHLGTFLALGVVVPLVILYQGIAAVRLCMEHRWSAAPAAERQRDAFIELTPCVFLGDAPPPRELRLSAPLRWLGAWALWWVRLAGIGLVRLLVLPGDSGPAHDYHHFEPRGDWANYIAAHRAFRAQLQRESGGRTDCIEVWGLIRAIDGSFRSFAAASLDGVPPRPAQRIPLRTARTTADAS
jgi:hypothetical protein